MRDELVKALRQAYYDVRNSPAAYAGASAFMRQLRERKIKATGDEVDAWLALQPTYTVMRAARRPFKAPKTIVAGMGE